MKLTDDVSLRHLNSFSVEARAGRLLEIEQPRDLENLTNVCSFDPARDLVLGGGSNILFAADIAGTVILNRLRGRRILEESSGSVLVEACGGENWHRLVRWTLARGLSGLENLSLIPGLAGAAPIQNIGAYGVELADMLESVLAVDLENGNIREFSNADCRFAYRESRFRSSDSGRYLISHIRLRLQRDFIPRLEYAGIAEALNDHGINRPTPVEVSDAVVRIRRRKLPDPARLANAGSFFKNPLVAKSTAERLRREFGQLPVHPLENGLAKLAAAWMIEHCGWKGHRERDVGVSSQHALVLVNHGHASGTEILDLAARIRSSVRHRFGIDLEPEPVIIR